ncbi:DUF1501 domain-containing protein [Novipirellula artificiosorum]|uniref:Sulfatase n=1 Tax=Novipirellula artificiosorum TaxID=2528016 RepID=A0A5C6DUS6_9BACT|nr:DUF1501 domain-containing protein [Novipirellula artificiosorum]TWU38529.1 hypothetical protein Poly41_30060 [Novipirellula artificiosorum]
MNRDSTRRQFLKVGALGTGLTLSQYLRLHASQTDNADKRSAIFIFMEGAPSHQDTFDLKPNAPVEVRGEFRPVKTSVAGVQICEHLPMLAERANKYAIIRGITHNVADHGLAKKYLLTGNKASQTVSYPEYGSVVSREFPSVPNLPTYVSIDESFVGPGYLGSRYSPLTAEKPRHGAPYTVRGISLEDGLTVEKYRSQKQLLDDLDVAFKGFEDLDDQVRGMDRFAEQAFDIISSPEARAAFDLSQEKPSESDRFGKHEFGQSLLLAARLIEAGVHFVTVRLRPAEFDFDTHQDNFSRLRTLLPPFDRGLAALFDRLEQRGLLSSTAIMAAGEFGRTPKINKTGGRDHWARAMCAVMAGGDVRGGQVIGATDATAAEPASVGFSPDDLAASFFNNIGISPKAEFQSNVGRPITLVRDGTPIHGLL